MKVTRQSTSVSLSIEYLGSCKDFAKDKSTLFVSNWANTTCLPISTDGSLRDINDIKPTQFCVNINDKKSVINFVGLPASYAVSFVPTNPFRSMLSKNYIRRPNCQVKQEYMTTSLSVTSCADNNVEIDTGYVVSDDRIYILPEGSVASTCFDTTNGCCPYINTNINNGICPNKASKRKLKLFFLNLETPADANRYSKDDFTIEPMKKIKETSKYGHQDKYGKNDKHHNDKSSYAYKKNEQAEINPSVKVESKKDINEIVIEVQSNNNKQLGKNIVEDEQQDESETANINHSKKAMNNMSSGRKGHHHSSAHQMGSSTNKNKPSSAATSNSNKSSPSKSQNKVSAPKPSKVNPSPAKSSPVSSSTTASSFGQNKNKNSPPFHTLDEPSDEDSQSSHQINYANDNQEDIYDDELTEAPQQNHHQHNGHHGHHEHHRPQNRPTKAPEDPSDLPVDTGNLVIDNSDDVNVEEFDFDRDSVFPDESSQDDDSDHGPHKPKNKNTESKPKKNDKSNSVNKSEKQDSEEEQGADFDDDDSIFDISLQNSKPQKIKIHKKQV